MLKTEDDQKIGLPGQIPGYNTKILLLDGKKIYVPHADISLRALLEFAASHHKEGSRYYAVILNGVHLAKIAIPAGILRRQKEAVAIA